MKKNLFNPATWVLVSCIAIMINPLNTQAQDKKEVRKTIIINNGDTIINGKNLKEVSKSERKKLLKELNEMKGVNRIEINEDSPAAKGNENMVVIRKKRDGQPEEVIVKRLKTPRAMAWTDGEAFAFGPNGAMPPHIKFDMDTLMLKMDGDSAFKDLHIRMRDFADKTPRIVGEGNDEFEFFVKPGEGPMAFEMGKPGMPGLRRLENNSQSFNYQNVDKDGISNRLNIRLGEAKKEDFKKITGSETAKTTLEVQDLTLFPSFSTGKLNLAFNLKSKGAVEVKILDTDFAVVMSDKQANFNESYYKSFLLPKNGIYYLAVAQNGNWFVKRLVKE